MACAFYLSQGQVLLLVPINDIKGEPTPCLSTPTMDAQCEVLLVWHWQYVPSQVTNASFQAVQVSIMYSTVMFCKDTVN